MQVSISMKDEGKALFFAYAGQHFFMHQDGVYQDYKRCQVTTEQEVEWADEMGAALLEHFKAGQVVDDEFHKLIDLIKGFKLIDLLRCLTFSMHEFEAEFDGFTKLLVCESILEALSYLRKNAAVKMEVVNEIKNIIAPISLRLSANEFTIGNIYRQRMQVPGTFNDSSIQQRIAALTRHL